MKGEGNFGLHLTVDCMGADMNKAGDISFVYDFLQEIVENLNMTNIIPPYVFPYSGLVPEDKGVTGTVIIAESHITFHSFTEKDYIFFDVFSCNHFDYERVVDMISSRFFVKYMDVNKIVRGFGFPRG